MYTEEEFAAFLAKQAADVADFAITNRESNLNPRAVRVALNMETEISKIYRRVFDKLMEVFNLACGLLSCSKKFKRDLDFQYSYASSTVQKRGQDHGSLEDQAVN
jgi:hypothetical protein